MKLQRTLRRRRDRTTYLDGQLLLAMPAMSDKRFARSVIYMCAHSEDGAMGLIINQRANHISAIDLLERLGIATRGPDDEVPDTVIGLPIHVGGPVETGRGFVLHSSDYFISESTLSIEANLSLTATVDILKAIVGGSGPNRAILALGYAGWSPGQLESEIQANGWLHCPADSDLVFDANLEHKYNRALATIGIDLSHLSTQAGRA